MATFKIKFRPSQMPDKEGTIYYQIIHNRQTRQYSTDYHLHPSEWDMKKSSVVTTNAPHRIQYLNAIRQQICLDRERFSKVIRKFESSPLDFSVADVIEEYKTFLSEYSIINFMQRIIDKFKANGKIRTSETYTAALHSFMKFRNDQDIMLDCIDSALMEAYEAWLKERGVVPNTVSFYTRILRAVYNRAVEDGAIDNRFPFRHVYTGIDKTVKRALPLHIIKKINALDLSSNPKLDFARDMFMLSFMLRGMSFVDMAFLRKSDLVNGYVVYRRHKTGQMLFIEWTKDMQKILEKYPENASEFLLPIITEDDTNHRSIYRNSSYKINYNLKIIAKMVDVAIPLTLYVARHSWASIARSKGIAISVISEGMGHDNETTTKIYLASLDTSAVDQANALILSCL